MPASSSGQTCCCSAAAIAPFSATGRGRSVEPVSVSRRCIIVRMLICALTPPMNGDAAPAARPSRARRCCAGRSRRRPCRGRRRRLVPPVASLIAATKSVVAIVDGAFRAEPLARARTSPPIPPSRTRARRTAAPAGSPSCRCRSIPPWTRIDLAGLQPAALEDVGPDREERLGNRRRMNESMFGGTGRHCGAGATQYSA